MAPLCHFGKRLSPNVRVLVVRATISPLTIDKRAGYKRHSPQQRTCCRLIKGENQMRRLGSKCPRSRRGASEVLFKHWPAKLGLIALAVAIVSCSSGGVVPNKSQQGTIATSHN